MSQKENESVGIGCMCLILFFFVCYCMNFQNLWQYWPDTENLSVLQFLQVVSIRWVISFIGVFFPPLGVITGLIW